MVNRMVPETGKRTIGLNIVCRPTRPSGTVAPDSLSALAEQSPPKALVVRMTDCAVTRDQDRPQPDASPSGQGELSWRVRSRPGRSPHGLQLRASASRTRRSAMARTASSLSAT